MRELINKTSLFLSSSLCPRKSQNIFQEKDQDGVDSLSLWIDLSSASKETEKHYQFLSEKGLTSF
jgi:hypothetical protein